MTRLTGIIERFASNSRSAGTPSEASVTWFDRCVPLAHSLAAHATEVDTTRGLTAAETRDPAWENRCVQRAPARTPECPQDREEIA